VAFNLTAPQGWSAQLWKDGSAAAFSATEGGALPPNYVDDGNILPNPNRLRPGQSLTGFSFQSPYAPSITDFAAQVATTIPLYNESDDAQDPPNMFADSFSGTTQGPASPNKSGNNIDDTWFFVRQQYLDFLNREPDLGGLSYWSTEIVRCGVEPTCINQRRVNVSAAYFVETEFQNTGSYIYRIYKASFGQRPKYLQFSIDRGRVVDGPQLENSKQAFAESWVLRPEFLAKYPTNLSGTQFIDALLATVRQGSGVDLAGKRAELINDFNVNNSRGRIVRMVTDNATFKQAEYNRAFVLMQYFGYLQREPDEGGYQFWLDVVNNRVTNNYLAMVCAFVTSTEYQQRFGSTITRNNTMCSNIGH
jgi:hypothetical protein